MGEISLGEALDELRSELYRAQADGTGQQLKFEVEKAELSLEVEFRREGNGKVKVAVGAFGAKAEGEAGGVLGSVQRQRLTLTLGVLDEAAGSTRARVSRGASGSAALPGKEHPTAGAGTPEPVDSAQSGGPVTRRPWDE
ncbi:trypco2 family protein [Streptomyces sp. NRRL B-24484]|uniref:trypco2 family protein n=1 Tax=Streptomyces sp. NRRL B-24484 TaxID=1463833 RepID=UPI000D12160E|nr:trypco2 family protein [Streptomyces sp. NRRL B-24484]